MQQDFSCLMTSLTLHRMKSRGNSNTGIELFQLIPLLLLKPILDRDVRVFKLSPHAARFQLPDDFYNLTPEEIKREQQHRYGAIPFDTSLPLKPILDRDVRVFKPSPHAARFQLPDDFYNLTPDEIKREQQHRYWAIPFDTLTPTVEDFLQGFHGWGIF